jgi:hypothetical protein
MYRRIAAIVAASMLIGSALIASGVGAAAAADPTAKVTGSYKYTNFGGGHRSASISATASTPVRGVWSWQDRRGPVTCLVVDGRDAWLAGPGTTGPETSVFIYVHDGGAPGTADDMATAWGQDPGQPFEELLDWCETQATHVPLFPLDSGNVTVRDLP